MIRADARSLVACIGIGLGASMFVQCVQVLGVERAEVLQLSDASTSEGGSTCGEGKSSCGGATCSIDLRTDPTNCGECGLRCAANNATATCQNGTCGLSCKPGFADCDTLATNACEVELAGNQNHCGKCGRSCGGGACTAGLCEPVRLSQSSADVRGFGVKGQELAVLAGWTLTKQAFATGDGVVVSAPPTTFVASFAFDSADLLFARQNQQDLRQVALFRSAGGAETCLVGETRLQAYAANTTDVYLAVGNVPNGLNIVSLPRGTSACVGDGTLTSLPSPFFSLAGDTRGHAFVVDGDLVYFAVGGVASSAGIYRIRTSAGQVDAVVTTAQIPLDPGATSLFADQTHLYWRSSSGLRRATKLTSCATEALCTEVFASDALGTALALDATSVYLAVRDVRRGFGVSARRKTDGTEVAFVPTPAAATALFVDDTWLAWSVGSAVYRTVKP